MLPEGIINTHTQNRKLNFILGKKWPPLLLYELEFQDWYYCLIHYALKLLISEPCSF